MGMTALLAVVVLVFFTCWLLAAGCSRAHIFVANQSGSTSNLVVSGSCEQRHLDILPATSEWKAVTPYHSGGHFQFSFVSAGSRHTISPDTGTNLCGFCGISFTIGSNMAVTSEVRK